MTKSILQLLIFIFIVGIILTGEKFGYKRESAIIVMVIIFAGLGFSLYKLKNKDDLSDTFLKVIYLLRGRREALFWGWFIWLFSLACTVFGILSFR